MSLVVLVWARWGDYVLGLHHVRPGQTLRAGSPLRPLVRCTRSGATVWSTDGMRQLVAGESVDVAMDGAQYQVRCAEVTDRRAFDPPSRRGLLLAAITGLCLLAFSLSFSERPRAEVRSEHFVRYAGSALPPVAREELESVEVELAVASLPQPTATRIRGEMRCGTAPMGARVADRSGRYGVAGPPDNADPHVARSERLTGLPMSSQEPVHGSVGLPRVAHGAAGPTAPWGREEQLGIDESNARGQVFGTTTREARGDLGFGVATQQGGVLKGIDVAAMGGRELRVVHTGLRIVGPRKESEVGRAMSVAFEDFRSCAEQAERGLQRQVELHFVVELDGTVTAAGGARSPLEACLDRRVADVKFAGGATAVAEVHYPLYFIPGSAELLSPRVTPSGAPTPCNCDG